MDEPVLTVEGLSVAFGKGRNAREVVSDVSFAIPKGKTVAIVGESGSGKSVTCNTIMGLLPANARATTGEILFNDPASGARTSILDCTSSRMRSLRGGRIAMIFQEPMSSLSPFHTIGNQVREALVLHGEQSNETARKRCLEVFEKVGFPDPSRAYDAYPFELSGGMRQRAMIAMATICRPALLIADEPTTALDVTTQALILDLIKQRSEQTGMSVLLITHDLGVVANIADYVTVMRKGKIVEAGNAYDLLTDPQHPYLQKLIAAAPQVSCRAQPEPSRDLILEARGITKTFAGRGKGLLGLGGTPVRALRGVDLSIPRGKTVALVGESGSGKTTLARVAMMAERPDPGGTLVYDDGTGPQDMTALRGADLKRFRREVQIVFQDPYASLSPRMTVQDILAEPLIVHDVCDAKERRERSADLLRKVGLTPDALGRFPHAFSGGQRQRISIARALTLEPKLLVCDEPTSALDVSVQAQVLDLLEGLREEFGLSYLFISHDLAVVSRLADEIAVMCRGAIVEQAPSRQLFEQPAHPYTRALMAAAPDPHPDHKLDLGAIAVGEGAAPERWPAPYGYDRNDPAPLREIDPGHFVRMV